VCADSSFGKLPTSIWGKYGMNLISYYQHYITLHYITIFVSVILYCPFAQTVERNTTTLIIKLPPSSSNCLVQQVSSTFD
jgi:hypothetical protein